MWFQRGIWTGIFQLHQIQNGRLLTIINFNRRDIWQAVPDAGLLLWNKMCEFKERYALKIQLDQIKKWLAAIVVFYMWRKMIVVFGLLFHLQM